MEMNYMYYFLQRLALSMLTLAKKNSYSYWNENKISRLWRNNSGVLFLYKDFDVGNCINFIYVFSHLLHGSRKMRNIVLQSINIHPKICFYKLNSFYLLLL